MSGVKGTSIKLQLLNTKIYLTNYVSIILKHIFIINKYLWRFNMLRHFELHFSERIGWLRAAVMGANDGIVSTASLIIGVAAAGTTLNNILLAAIAGLVAGAMSMAAGEYVSVSSQADTEKSDLEREKKELENDWENELKELTNIYINRGLDEELAMQVAEQLMEHDALATHARDELGITEIHRARPIQAALASAATFAIGAALPVVLAAFSGVNHVILTVSVSSLVFLALLGAIAAKTGGAKVIAGTFRVTFWGALAMGLTAAVGMLFGAHI
jgi:VIT1/CCC1 family predicted Fe2+/Mn2+ transporter